MNDTAVAKPLTHANFKWEAQWMPNWKSTVTLGSITIATMRKLVDRCGVGDGRRLKAALSRRRDQPRF